jgi:hypothetical protein
MNLDRKAVLVIGVFVTAVFGLAITLLRPITVNVMFEGSGPAAAAIPGVYTLADCVVIALAAFLIGVTSRFLILSGLRSPQNQEMKNSDPAPEIFTHIHMQSQNLIEGTGQESPSSEESVSFLNMLKGNERVVAEALMQYGEMNQADLSARTGIPKSTLSRTLQNLEERKLIFRYDNGMSKMVKLEIHR